ncbi:hypothetical protein CXF85_09535 [Colwellia sp. 75C3]|uniref:hypothetical protein n=1 Tax=Colwellia sp. 75C3 TaxID=888425 RepID=UPI000CB082F9|nr:hypothetical protein [Colwellia sp. 75C3]PKG83740.1 hypothetical protein CXF85_09535 [Colwellia sp. 75C3]
MKMINPHIKVSIISRAKQCFSISFIILLVSLSSACQVTAPVTETKTETSHDSVKYSQYYLWLKTLNNKQLLLEEKQQYVLMTNQLKDKAFSQGKLILIYSLPNPVIYQPYKAKRLLNEHLLTSNILSKENLAFTMLLRDQLNTQLHLLEKQALSEQGFTKQSDEHHKIIEQLNQQLNHANQQLMLLKQIDQNINERD